jgi:hypothetical protein
MLIVVILALLIALVIERQNRERELRRLKSELAESKRLAMSLKAALQAPYQALARSETGARNRSPASQSPGRMNVDVGR